MTNKDSAKGKVDLTRRRLLLGMAAAPFSIHPCAWASTPNNSDVIIVGAGAAGLGAAVTLSDLGVSFVMIEAQSRIGGRAYSDHHTFGVPYDMGCHWLNYGRVNPWFDYGNTFGFTLTPVPDDDYDKYGLFVCNRRANATEVKAYDDAYNRIEEKIGWVAEKSKNPDISPADAIKLESKWDKLSAYMMGPLDAAKEFDDFSCQDWWETPGSDPYFCKEG